MYTNLDIASENNISAGHTGPIPNIPTGNTGPLSNIFASGCTGHIETNVSSQPSKDGITGATGAIRIPGATGITGAIGSVETASSYSKIFTNFPIDPSKLVYYYLFLQNKFVVYYAYCRNLITNTKEISIIKNNRTCSIFWRYSLIKFLNCFVNFFTFLRNKVDIKTDKIHVVKYINNSEKPIILDSVISNKEQVCIQDVIDQETTFLQQKRNNTIYLKCNLTMPNEVICLKKYIMMYNNTTHKHFTLKNVLLFNNINIDDGAVINIEKMKNGKREKYDLEYDKICDEQIYLL